MKLSLSNIAWENKYDNLIYEKMNELGFQYIEIAPTRLVGERPYLEDGIKLSKEILYNIKNNYNINICSIQSILYGINYRLFYSEEERIKLYDEMIKAVDYAYKVNCKNIVFGCPKNRVIQNVNSQYKIGVDFFRRVSKYAKEKDIYISFEANPSIYDTNYINTTIEAKQLIDDVSFKNFGINYDIGTVIYNNENVEYLEKIIDSVNHIHISEPYLNIIKKRDIHLKIRDILKERNYRNVISVEMKKTENINDFIDVMMYISNIFN